MYFEETAICVQTETSKVWGMVLPGQPAQYMPYLAGYLSRLGIPHIHIWSGYSRHSRHRWNMALSSIDIYIQVVLSAMPNTRSEPQASFTRYISFPVHCVFHFVVSLWVSILYSPRDCVSGFVRSDSVTSYTLHGMQLP